MGAAGRRTKYDLRDASGALIAVHLRVDGPATVGQHEIAAADKAVFWLTPDGRFASTANPLPVPLVDLPLYGIERLGSESQVVVAEGEKAALALIEAGIQAVGTVTGSSATPSRRSLGDLNGRHVVLWPDNDAVGRGHMKRIARLLRGIAATVRWVEWAEAPAHGDAYDLIATGGKEAVWDLLDAAQAVLDATFSRKGLGYAARFEDGSVDMTFDHVRRHTSGDMTGELAVVCLDGGAPDDGHLLQGSLNASAIGTRKSVAKVLAERAPNVKVDWASYLERFCRYILDTERVGEPTVIVGDRPRRPAIPFVLDPLLVESKGTILFGPEGTGKSFLAAAAVVSVTTGLEIVPGWYPKGPPRRCLILDWEDDEDEWNDRLARITSGAKLKPIRAVYRYGRGPLSEDVEEIARIVADAKAGMVVIDSVNKASPPGREGGDPADAPIRLFAGLRYIGGTHLLLDHVPKSEKGGSDRPYGSVMKPALARVTFELSRVDDEDDPDVATLVMTNRKRNSGARTKPMAVKIIYSDDAVHFGRADLPGPLQGYVEQIMALLARGHPLTHGEIGDALGFSRETVRKTMDRHPERWVRFPDPLDKRIVRWGLAVREEAA